MAAPPKAGEPCWIAVGREADRRGNLRAKEIIPATVKVIRHVCRKYACPCCEQHVVTANKPKQALGKSMAGPGLLAYIATAKYQDALPLYRQVKIFERLGVELDRTTLANWMVRCGKLIQPLINRLVEDILEQRLVHMDDQFIGNELAQLQLAPQG